MKAPDRGLEVGTARGRQQERVGRAGQLPDLAKTERICECHLPLWCLRLPRLPLSPPPPSSGPPAGRLRIKTTLRLWDERSNLPRCHPHSASLPLSWPTGRALALALRPRARLPPIGAALYRWRSAPEPTGEPWKFAVWSGGSRVHSLSSPPQLAPTAGSLRRRRELLVPITARIRMWRGVYGRIGAAVKRGVSADGTRDVRAKGRGRSRAIGGAGRILVIFHPGWHESGSPGHRSSIRWASRPSAPVGHARRAHRNGILRQRRRPSRRLKARLLAWCYPH